MFWGKKKEYLKRRAEWLSAQTYVTLAIRVPKDNDKTPQSAEQFFAALHGIFRDDPAVQEHVSFEIVAEEDSIMFYVCTPIHLKDFIESQLYAQYPKLQIHRVEDYTKQAELGGKTVAFTKMQLTKEDLYPIKTFTSSEVDPLAGITAVLSGMDKGEHVWIQMIVRPVGDNWQQRGIDLVNNIRSGKTPTSSSSNFAGAVFKGIRSVVMEIVTPGSSSATPEKADSPEKKISGPQQAALTGVESKITKLGFETIFRIVVVSETEVKARAKIQAILGAFKQYNTTNLNGFKSGEIKINEYDGWEKYINREFEEVGNVLNIEELASVYHFPSQQVETGSISWAGSKKGEAPFNLPLKGVVDPKILTVLGKTDFRNIEKEFGIKLEDRKKHMYVIGKSGAGKSTLLENMVIDDVLEGRGVIVIDPHGEFADKIIDSIPESRIKDVIVLDPSDRDFPIAFNLLETVRDDYKGMVASGFVGIFKKIFGNSWGPRLEYILRNTVLALLDTEGSTMLGIPKMLTDQSFRVGVIKNIKDSVIRDFWSTEFAAMDNKQRSEAVAPILNKVGQFLSTSTIRNIVGQPKSTIDIRQIMDDGKIMIVNLSKGKIGEDNMALLGAMIITKVQLAAMSRASIAAKDRTDCFLYVDEFQNFATDSFATILSEARKYGLGLTIAHQYIAQMEDGVKEAVFGNVGTLISFRVGSADAKWLCEEFEPVFDNNDLINLQMARIYIKLLIDGIAMPAFSAQTLPPKKIENSFREQVIQYSRDHYSKSRLEVEEAIDDFGGYKKRREIEEKNKEVEEILKQGAAVMSIDRVETRIVEEKPAQNPVGVIKVERGNSEAVVFEDKSSELPVIKESQSTLPNTVQNTNRDLSANLAVSSEQPKEGRDKPLKKMDGWVYKEVSQKGGMRWFLGEKEEEYARKAEEKKKIINEECANSENAQSPSSISPTEQYTKMPNNDFKPIEPNVGQKKPETKDMESIEIKEGQTIDI